jgi:uncharacterized lipoprotein YajG
LLFIKLLYIFGVYLLKNKNMQKSTFLLLLSIPFLLAACEMPLPLVFGVPQDQWDQLSQQQRSQVIEGYNQREQTKAQVEPLVAAVDALAAKNSNSAPAIPSPPAPAAAQPARPHHHRDQ